MKLYTREQMIEAFNYGQTLKGFDWVGDMIDSLKAIELPSDSICINCDESKSTHNICMDCIIKVGKENIELPSDEQIQAVGQEQILYNTSKRNWWILGAVWLKDQIQGSHNIEKFKEL